MGKEFVPVLEEIKQGKLVGGSVAVENFTNLSDASVAQLAETGKDNGFAEFAPQTGESITELVANENPERNTKDQLENDVRAQTDKLTTSPATSNAMVLLETGIGPDRVRQMSAAQVPLRNQRDQLYPILQQANIPAFAQHKDFFVQSPAEMQHDFVEFQKQMPTLSPDQQKIIAPHLNALTTFANDTMSYVSAF